MGKKLGHGALVHTLVAKSTIPGWLQPSDKEIWGVAYVSKILVIMVERYIVLNLMGYKDHG